MVLLWGWEVTTPVHNFIPAVTTSLSRKCFKPWSLNTRSRGVVESNQLMSDWLINWLFQAANDKFVKEKQSGQAATERETMLKDLATAYDIYMELLGNLQEGTKVLWWVRLTMMTDHGLRILHRGEQTGKKRKGASLQTWKKIGRTNIISLM